MERLTKLVLVLIIGISGALGLNSQPAEADQSLTDRFWLFGGYLWVTQPETPPASL